MSTYCTIEESFGGSLLSSNSLSTGVTNITNIKQRKSKSKKQIVPHAFEDSSNSFCSLNSDDSNRITTLSANVPEQPSYYRQGPIEEERAMVPHSIQYNGHNEQSDNYGIVQSETQENYNNVEVVESQNNQQNNKNNNNNNNNNNNVDETLKTILKRLDRMEERLNKQSTSKSNSNIHDIILYVVMGIFLLFILDSVFKIGKLTL
jgi:hypothetical protein